ncbi:exodeoxyribonuclease V subunit gamma [Escherichia coli]|uniref:Exodeoxyribonuclease V subunit gamma n=1 Tax=Escherichia coli TaxID=562 RepID=A0A376LA75_ECOLX|nr:exodeoxyribonuclease V subunit gamma [Escherichia coli]
MLRVYHSNRLDVLEALMEFIVERETAGRSFRTRNDSGAKYRYGAVAANDPVAKVWYCGKH